MFGQKFAKLIDWTIIINSTISVETSSFILIKDLKKAYIYISDFGILKVRSNKISALDVNNTIFKTLHDNPDFKPTFSNLDINVLSNKTKKDSKNTKLKLIEKRPIYKPFAWSHCRKFTNIKAMPWCDIMILKFIEK